MQRSISLLFLLVLSLLLSRGSVYSDYFLGNGMKDSGGWSLVPRVYRVSEAGAVSVYATLPHTNSDRSIQVGVAVGPDGVVYATTFQGLYRIPGPGATPELVYSHPVSESGIPLPPDYPDSGRLNSVAISPTGEVFLGNGMKDSGGWSFVPRVYKIDEMGVASEYATLPHSNSGWPIKVGVALGSDGVVYATTFQGLYRIPGPGATPELVYSHPVSEWGIPLPPDYPDSGRLNSVAISPTGEVFLGNGMKDSGGWSFVPRVYKIDEMGVASEYATLPHPSDSTSITVDVAVGADGMVYATTFQGLYRIPGPGATPELVYSHPVSEWGIPLPPDYRDSGRLNSVAIGLPQPLIFIPGIAGSVLKSNSGETLWPTILPNKIRALNLRTGSSSIEAVDVTRKFTIPIPIGLTGLTYDYDEILYEPFIDHLVANQNYVEFDLEGDPERMRSAFAQATSSLDPKPSLFVFPYDWRRSNADHIDQLQEYISNISELHGGAKVNIVAHSMGNLLLRRYILEYGADDVNRVVTVGAPFWGAPQAVFRLLQGDFYGVYPLDLVNNSAFKETLPTLRGFHELLPNSYYLNRSSNPIIAEDLWDFDGDRVPTEDYTTEKLRSVVDQLSDPDTPFANNDGFFADSRQSDWSGDDDSIEYLHLYGYQSRLKTTHGIRIRARTFLGEVLEDFSPIFDQVLGSGDGVVPLLSSYRDGGGFKAPMATYRPISNVDDDLTEHTGMFSNPDVFNLIDTFLTTGQTDVAPPPPSMGREEDSPPPVPERRRIEIFGVGFVAVSNGNSDQNTRINEMTALPVPGIEIEYGGSGRWVFVEFDATESVTITNQDGAPIVEFDYTEIDTDGNVTLVQRLRLETGSHSWTCEIPGGGLPDLRLDTNDDDQFTPDEMIPPTHTGTDANLDLVAPTIALELTPLSGGAVSVTISAADETDPTPMIRYSTNDGPVADYTSPLVFSPSTQAMIKAFATDSMGNTSGLVQTEVRPQLTATSGSGTIDIEWSIAEGFILEEAMNLSGPWTQSAVLIQREGTRERASVPTGGAERKFFRLRSRRIEK